MMYQFERLKLDSLDPKLLKLYKALTTPEFQPLLNRDNKLPSLMTAAIAVTYWGEPVGLCVATYPFALGYRAVHIHSFYIAPDHRHQKIGSKLWRETERFLKEDKCYVASFLYPDDLPSNTFFTKILLKEGWSAPEVGLTRFFFDCREFHPKWFERKQKQSSKFKIFPWSKLTKKERKLLKTKNEHSVFDSSVSPFFDEELMDLTMSVGLRYEGDVIGWMIVHRVGKNAVRYTAFYIHPRYQFSGQAIRLLGEAIRLQQASNSPWSYFDVSMDAIDPHWKRFIDGRLKPFAQKVVHFVRTWKDL